MLINTEAIVLYHIKYRDTSLIVHLYTKKFGRIAGIINNVRSVKSKISIGIFQSLFLLDINLYYSDNKNLYRIKDVKLSKAYKSISGDVKKSAICLFIAEVLFKCLKEESSDEDLFVFLKESLLHFDNRRNDPDFHIKLLLHLTRFLGFYPLNNYDQSIPYFDLQNGRYCNSPPQHSHFINKAQTTLWHSFLNNPIENSTQISGPDRKTILEHILDYYKVHLEGFSDLKSLSVLREIFN